MEGARGGEGISLLCLSDSCKRTTEFMAVKITRTCSRCGAIANPHAKVLTPEHPQVRTLENDPGNRFSLKCFLSFICENTHKVWYKSFEIDLVTEI